MDTTDAFGIRIYREVTNDPTSRLVFEPAEGSDDLHDLLRKKYPLRRFRHLKTYDQRRRFAIREFRLQELLAEARAEGDLDELEAEEKSERIAPEQGYLQTVHDFTHDVEVFGSGLPYQHPLPIGDQSWQLPQQPYDLLNYVHFDQQLPTIGHFGAQFEQPLYDEQRPSDPENLLYGDSPQIPIPTPLTTALDPSSGEIQPVRRGSRHGTPYTRHVKISGGYSCDGCEKIFDRQCDLNHHRRIHEVRPNECIVCGRGFLYPKDLRRHVVKIHQTEHQADPQSGGNYAQGRAGPGFFSKHYRRHWPAFLAAFFKERRDHGFCVWDCFRRIPI